MKQPPTKNTGKPVQKKQSGKPQPKNTQAKTQSKFDLPEVKKWSVIIGLVIFTFLLYGNTIMHGYALDDDIITRQNGFVQQGVHGISRIFSKGFLYGFNGRNDQSYRPITLTSIAIEKQIWGNSPHVHHFFNVIWYAVTAVFLFLTLVKIFRKSNYIVPLVITLLFIAHPIHTEVVANIKSRDEILSFLFCILAVYCSLTYYENKLDNPESKFVPKSKGFHINKSQVPLLILSWIFFALAILSKETVLMYVFIIPMIYYYFTDFPFEKILMIALPFAALFVVYMFVRKSVLDSITFNEQMQIINNSLMAAKTPSDRLATAIYTMGKYVWLLFAPLSLTFDYSYAQIPIVSFSSPQALISIAVYVGLIAYALFRLVRKDPVSFGILYYVIMMVLVSNVFVKIGSSMGERFLYTSSLGFCIAIGILIMRLLKIKTDTLRPKLSTLYGVVGVILLAYSVKTIARNTDWKDNFTLFEADVNVSPNSARAHQSLAITYTDTAINTSNPVEKSIFFNKAIREYNAALKILPSFSEALFNKGWNYYSMGNYDSAVTSFVKCVYVSPDYIPAYQDLGVIYFNSKDYNKAISIFKLGLTRSPGDAGLYANVGASYYNMDKYDSAVFYLHKALDINPRISSARENLEKAQNVLNAMKK